jgi:hypothetical protein
MQILLTFAPSSSLRASNRNSNNNDDISRGNEPRYPPDCKLTLSRLSHLDILRHQQNLLYRH